MILLKGDIHEAVIEDTLYRLLVYDRHGTSTAVFVEPAPHDPGCYVLTGIPPILSQFPDLLDVFAEALALKGHTLIEGESGKPVLEKLV